MKIHEKNCPHRKYDKLQLSCDGISECKSNSNSIDVYSCAVINCRTIYPHRLVRPLNGYNVPHREQLSSVLNDILKNGCQLKHFVGDNPKRSDANETLRSSSWYPCEYYFAKGTKVEFIDRLTKKVRKSNIVWPASSMNGELRTREKIEEILQKMENGEVLDIDEAKGVKGRSLLMDVPDFDHITDSVVEYLHSVCLGLVKRLVELTYSVGENRPKVTNRKLVNPSKFNKLMFKVKVFHEFSRRARELNLAVFKAQEYRNLILFFFPIVLDNLKEPEHKKEREVWLYLAFMIRSCVLPKREFQCVNISDIEKCCKLFYELFEKQFGVRNCSYSVHVVPSHLLQIRHHGPLTFTSAFKFESFYAEIRRSFTPGTQSPLKQILENILIKRSIGHHCCEKSIEISNYETSLQCNSLIYTFNNRVYKFYRVKEVNEDNTLTCYEQGKNVVKMPEAKWLHWAQVGVYKQGILSSDPVTINVSDVCGKLLLVENYLITCPNNVLRES